MVRTLARLTAIGMTMGAVQALSLQDVMHRVGAYVDSYGDRASIVVATEKYSQREVYEGGRFSSHRDLVSDVAIMQTKEHQWVGFRDVLEVDGKAIEDRQDRLVRLLNSGTLDEAQRVTEESARFNIGPRRNFNVPTAAMFFFTGENLDRFKFKSKGAAANGVWSIDFQERSTPTLILQPDGTPVLSQGTIWTEPDGAVVRTHLGLHVNSNLPSGTVVLTVDVDVTYTHVATLDMWLPAVMTESYESQEQRGVVRVSTRADYSNYRTFQTSVKIK